MSPRAAWRLESLGFATVYDYAAGAADWFASGLPRAGRDAAIPRAGDVARRDAPTCGLDDRVGDVRDRAREAGWDHSIVVNDEHVVLGRLRGTAFETDTDAPVGQVMEAGPTTIRPDVRLTEAAEQMRANTVTGVVVTTSDGRLLGVLVRTDAERRLRDT